MKLTYITGSPGVGKTEAGKVLKANGYASCDIDDDKIAVPVSRITGEMASEIGNTNQWHDEFQWDIQSDKLKAVAKIALLTASPDKRDRVFVTGTVTHDERHWDMFDQHFSIVVQPDTVERRLKERAGNSFGKTEDEQQRVLNKMSEKILLHCALGAVLINGEQSRDKVVQDILTTYS